jgi:hypothetical protein
MVQINNRAIYYDRVAMKNPRKKNRWYNVNLNERKKTYHNHEKMKYLPPFLDIHLYHHGINASNDITIFASCSSPSQLSLFPSEPLVFLFHLQFWQARGLDHSNQDDFSRSDVNETKTEKKLRD